MSCPHCCDDGTKCTACSSGLKPALKKLKYVPDIDDTIYFPEDVNILRKALNRRGYDAEDLDIQLAWQHYSDEFHRAMWLSLSDSAGGYEADLILKHNILEADD